MMTYLPIVEIRTPTSESYSDVVALLRDIEVDNMRRRSKKLKVKLEVDSESAIQFYTAALNCPDGRLIFPLIYVDNQLVGFMVVQELMMPKVARGMVTMEPYSFIWAAYKRPFVVNPYDGRRVNLRDCGTDEALRYVVNWGRSRGHKLLSGNCPADFKHKAAARMGFKVVHLVMGMEL